jgi:hypothetical protein
VNAAADADALLQAAQVERILTNRDPLWCRAMADLESGRDQPEPHQVAALISYSALSIGELRDLAIYNDVQAVRARAIAEFEQRIRSAGHADMARPLRSTARRFGRGLL